MKVAAWVGMLAALACIDCLAEMVRHQESTGASPAKLERMPEALEVEFALSFVGRRDEKAQILAQSKHLQAELCAYRAYLCTTTETLMRMPND